jgi:predicted RNase H-like nuclease (RuvC/YqgF family)
VSDSERPDLAAFRELEQLVQAMADEMAALRRRAQTAEARLRQTELDLSGGAAPAKQGSGTGEARDGRSRKDMERENAELKRRLALARERAEQLIAQVRFLRQQQAEMAS